MGWGSIPLTEWFSQFVRMYDILKKNRKIGIIEKKCVKKGLDWSI